MNRTLSPNTQAILLLTAPLIVGRGRPSEDLLTPGEYKRLALHLQEIQREPADLLSSGADKLHRVCQSIVKADRLQRLLERGFLLSQVMERWQSRAIWIVSRADSGYPRRLKCRLKRDAPAVLYGCGDIRLADSGSLAVVGSRHVDDFLVEYTRGVGRLVAKARRTLVSGGARGIDQAAMRGALETGGSAVGVLADALEKTAMNRENRNRLLDGQLLLLSPYDPSAGFNVGHAMQRNKLIYALANAALVVSSDLNKGGTWAGATEQLAKLHLVPVYVRATGNGSKGLDGLRQKGAQPWPEPDDPDTLAAVIDNPPAAAPGVNAQPGLSLFEQVNQPTAAPPATSASASKAEQADTDDLQSETAQPSLPQPPAVAEELFVTVRQLLQRLLATPMKDTEVAAALQVSNSQAREWLQRLTDEGVLEKQKRPVRYIVRQQKLFG